MHRSYWLLSYVMHPLVLIPSLFPVVTWSLLRGEPEPGSMSSPMRLLAICVSAHAVSACTTYAAGRLATADGTVRPPARPALLHVRLSTIALLQTGVGVPQR